jgi:predicted HD superfamily hydrolase involved in NAD metabolism
MKETDIVKLHKKLLKRLPEDRYMHTLGVEFTAASLAMKFGYDVGKARLAGLLHDCAKGIESSEYTALCEKYNISVNEAERANPGLLHAKLGGFFAMRKYHVTDMDIIDAIICHTTGKPDMTMLEKILYVADYIEPGRSELPKLTELRALAFEDLDAALLELLSLTMDHLKTKGYVVDPMTEKTYQYYLKKENYK